MNFSARWRVMLATVLFLVFSPAIAASKKRCKPCKPVECCQNEITQLPYTITEPGIYCVNRTLTHTGGGPAITIAGVTNVRLIFVGASLISTNPAATGISISQSTEVTVEKAAIVGGGNAYLIADSTDVVIERSVISDCLFGFQITNSSDIELNDFHINNQQISSIINSKNITINNGMVVNSNNGFALQFSEAIDLNTITFDTAGVGLSLNGTSSVNVRNFVIENNGSSGVSVGASTNIIFKDGVLRDNNIGINFNGPASQDCQLLNCSFPNSTGQTNLFVQAVEGLMIDGCSFSSTGAPGMRTLAQCGDPQVPAGNANDITIRNSTFVNHSTNDTIDGLSLLKGSGCVIDSIIVDIIGGFFGGIVLSSRNSQFLGAFISNSMVKGQSIFGVNCNTFSKSVIFDNCTIIRDASPEGSTGIFMSLNDQCNIRNCTINGFETGVFNQTPDFGNNAVVDNILLGNATPIVPATSMPSSWLVDGNRQVPLP